MKKLLYVLFLVTIVSCGKSAEEISLAQQVDSLHIENRALQKANDTLSDHLFKKSFATL